MWPVTAPQNDVAERVSVAINGSVYRHIRLRRNTVLTKYVYKRYRNPTCTLYSPNVRRLQILHFKSSAFNTSSKAQTSQPEYEDMSAEGLGIPRRIHGTGNIYRLPS